MIYTRAIPDKTHITSLKFINLVFFIDIFFEKTSYPDCIYYYRVSYRYLHILHIMNTNTFTHCKNG